MEARAQNLDRFARLALTTTIATYILIGVGALVRAAGAGLGCPDWPRCFGVWIPPTTVADLPPGWDPRLFNPVHTWLEYVNRLIGVAIGFLIIATAAVAVRRYRHRSEILWPTIGAFVLVLFQGWLGGQVVAQDLDAHVLTAHLVVALIIVGLLLHATLSAAYNPLAGNTVARSQARIGWYALGVLVLLLIQAAAGTQVRSAIQDLEIARPSARDGWLPLPGWWPDLAHRQLSIMVATAIASLWVAVRQSSPEHPGLRRWSTVALALCGAQIVAGVALAYFGVPPAFQVLHLVGAALLVGSLSIVHFNATRLAPWPTAHARPAEAL